MFQKYQRGGWGFENLNNFGERYWAMGKCPSHQPRTNFDPIYFVGLEWGTVNRRDMGIIFSILGEGDVPVNTILTKNWRSFPDLQVYADKCK